MYKKMYGYDEFGYGMDNGYSMGQQRKPHRVTKREILNFIIESTQCSEIVQVESCEGPIARHICAGGKSIQLLQKQSYPLQTDFGEINIEYYFCNICRKCIVDRASIETSF